MGMLAVLSLCVLAGSLATPLTKNTDINGAENEEEIMIEKRAVGVSSTPWPPSNEIPYRFDPKQPLVDADKQEILKTLEYLESNTCLQFKESSTSKTGLLFRKPDSGGRCSADIGYREETMTNVNIPKGCGKLPAFVHEIFHAFGYAHEQTSFYRAPFVVTLWTNLPESKRLGYNPYQSRLSADLDPYDPLSVMHYPMVDSAKNPIMALLDPTMDDYYRDVGADGIGDMRRTFLDFWKVSKMFKCMATVIYGRVKKEWRMLVPELCHRDACKSTECENTGFAIKTKLNPACHCKCPKYLSGPKCDEITAQGSKRDCSKIHKIAEGQKITLTFPKDGETYMKGVTCANLIKAEPGLRIKATITRLDLVITQTIDAQKQCRDHWVGFTTNRISSPLFKYCSSIPRKDKPQEVLSKSTLIPDEAHLMMIVLDSSGSNTNTGTKKEAGVTVEVTAYRSGCLKMKCKLPAVCKDSDDMKSSKCVCTDGYSGPTCSDVKKDSVVTADFDSDIDRVSFFRVDTAGDMGMEFTALPDKLVSNQVTENEEEKNKLKPLPNSGSAIFGTFDGKFPPQVGPGRLTTKGVNFEEGERCLSFRFVLRKEGKSNPPCLSVWISGEGVARKKLWEKVESKDSKWENVKLQLPAMKELQIELQYDARESETNPIGIDDFVLQPTCTAPCYPNPCKYSGRCLVKENQATCSCAYGFSGKNCEILPCPPNYCQNNGRCKVVDGMSKCLCNIPYTGPKCEEKLCNPNTCKYGQCTPFGEDNVPKIKCDCNQGYRGATCSEKLCKPDTCKNGGECTADDNINVKCYCKTGYAGQFCERLACDPNPCKNNGKCVADGDEDSGFRCTCSDDYEGDLCERKSVW